MLDIQNFLGKPTINWAKEEETNASIFKFGPVPNGIGHSIGNLIRRTLLSYTPGVAVTAINLNGVGHEYSSIEGVKETLLQIMLNFKALKFNGTIDGKIEWVKKKFKGIGKYYIEDLDLPGEIEIVTDNKYLFEITDPNVELEISYRLENGYKYLSVDELQKREKKMSESEDGIKSGNILIDNDFMLVKNVSYEVEEIISDFSGDYTDYVVIKMETISDKVSAKDILSFVGEVVSSYTKMFVFDESYINQDLLTDIDDFGSGNKSNEDEFKEVKKTPIDSLPTLSERTRNALIKNQIEFVEDLEKRTRTELISLKGVGKKAVDEIQEALEQEGKQLGAKK